MALNALVHATVALVKVILLGDLVAATMSHVVIVADTLFLLVPTAVSMQPSWKVRATSTVPILLLWARLGLRSFLD